MNLSLKQLATFAAVFAAVGGYALWYALAAPNPNLKGDLNNDNTVNVTDLSILLSYWNTNNPAADINLDNTVNITDLSILLSYWGQSYSSGTVNDATTGTGTNQFEFSSGWLQRTDANDYQGDEHYSNVTDAYYQVRFSGTQIKAYLSKDTSNGMAGFSIDGGAETWYDTYWSVRQNQVLAYTSPVLTDGPHTLKVRVTGSKNASSTGTYVVADRVDVTGSGSTGQISPPPPPSGQTRKISSTFDNDGVLPSPWVAYNFFNSNHQAGYYLPSHVIVANGMLTLRQSYETTGPAKGQSPYGPNGEGWYQGTIYDQAGAAGSIDHTTTTRMRVVSIGGITSHRNMPLWWTSAADGNYVRDGEEDFFETDKAWGPVNAMQVRSFMHYCNKIINTNCSTSASPSPWVATYKIWSAIDMTQWHTYRLQRLNHTITVWIDNMSTPFYTWQLSSTELPDAIKHAVFQQENDGYVPPAGSTGSEDIQFDWITVDTPS